MKTKIPLIIAILISLNISCIAQDKIIKSKTERPDMSSWIGSEIGNPKGNNSVVAQPEVPQRVKELIAEQRKAKLSGNHEKCEQLQQLIDKESQNMGSTVKLTPYPGGGKFIGEKLTGLNSVHSSVIFNPHYQMQSTATYTEQIGKNIGRVWVFVQSGALGQYAADTIRALYSDDNGASWTYHSIYWLANYDKIYPDGMDVEIIETTSGDKYIWLTYGVYNFSPGKKSAGLLIIREPGVFQSAMYSLSWPGENFSNTGFQTYYPRISSDNASYQNGSSYVYIAASFDSSTSSGIHSSQKIAFCTNPYTISPSITYRATALYWSCYQNSWFQIHTDIQYFSKNIGSLRYDSLMVVWSNSACDPNNVYSTKFDEQPDIYTPKAGPILNMGFPNVAKDFAKIAGNGGTDLMIVARNNYANSGDWDIITSHSTDGGISWSASYIDGRPNTVNIPHQPEIFGKKDNIRTGIYKVAYLVCSSGVVGSYDSIYTSYYPAVTNSNWSPYAAVNSSRSSRYSNMGKPSFMNNPNDSCFVVWISDSLRSCGSLGCEGTISSSNPYNGSISKLNNANEFSINQNYPNPFNPITSIKFVIPIDGNVTLKVFDVLGGEVATLIDEKLIAGEHEIQFNGTNLASGVYFYKIETENFVNIKKMVLIK